MNRDDYPDLTEEEYLAFERAAELEHEERLTLAAESPEHVLIASNIGGELRGRLKGRPFRVYQNDLRVHVTATGFFACPDVTVIAGPIRLHLKDGRSALNPNVVFEVLSRATEAFDRGAKFAHYRQLPDLAEYVLVAQERRLVEHFRRLDSGQWLLTVHDEAGDVQLSALGIALPLDEIYAGVDLPPVV
jgi:Uma2 family endonuclease